MATLATYFAFNADPDACRYDFDGTDTDGTDWYRCTVHDNLSMGDDWPCEGWNQDTTDQHGAGTCTTNTCEECRAEQTCPSCGAVFGHRHYPSFTECRNCKQRFL